MRHLRDGIRRLMNIANILRVWHTAEARCIERTLRLCAFARANVVVI
jgi:hypothetical protein